jgi:hypothetical protein
MEYNVVFRVNGQTTNQPHEKQTIRAAADMLVTHGLEVDVENIRPQKKKEKKKEDSFDCPVCLEKEPVTRMAKTVPCDHQYCRVCIFELWNTSGECPYCRQIIDHILFDYKDGNAQKKRTKKRGPGAEGYGYRDPLDMMIFFQYGGGEESGNVFTDSDV